ncbi:MAG: PEP-CTERM sorting domain-containing protein [Verrucomicrobia bacterium]|nr:PEP-CTERM sorting domain-containing protein [Verrucomicrobiota bacterium]
MILGTGGSATYPTIWVGDAADLTFATNSLPSLVAGDIFKLLDWSTAFGSGGNFSGGAGNTFNLATDLVLPGLGAGLSWDTTAFKSYGVLGVSGVPEPGRMMLMFFGLAALFLRRRRNR